MQCHAAKTVRIAPYATHQFVAVRCASQDLLANRPDTCVAMYWSAVISRQDNTSALPVLSCLLITVFLHTAALVAGLCISRSCNAHLTGTNWRLAFGATLTASAAWHCIDRPVLGKSYPRRLLRQISGCGPCGWRQSPSQYGWLGSPCAEHHTPVQSIGLSGLATTLPRGAGHLAHQLLR